MDLGPPPPPQYVQDKREMVDAETDIRTMRYDASNMNGKFNNNSPTGSPGVDKKSGRRREMIFDPSINGGKRRTRKQKRSGKKSKTSKKRSGKKSKTSKKRGSRKRA